MWETKPDTVVVNIEYNGDWPVTIYEKDYNGKELGKLTPYKETSILLPLNTPIWADAVGADTLYQDAYSSLVIDINSSPSSAFLFTIVKVLNDSPYILLVSF